MSQEYKTEFDYIISKYIPEQKTKTDLNTDSRKCKYCNIPLSFEETGYYYVCTKCGVIHSMGDKVHLTYKRKQMYMKNNYNTSKVNLRHKEKRLKSQISKLGIKDDILIAYIFKIFREYNEYDHVYSNNRNLPRYSYLILKILELKGINLDSDVKLSKSTIKKYESKWNEFCKFFKY